MITFGEWVTSQREAKSLTKTECARRAGFSAQRWAQIEQPNRRREAVQTSPSVQLSTVKRVAQALDVPASDALRAAGFTNAVLPQDEPTVVAYYNALPHQVQEDVLEMLRVLYRRHNRDSHRKSIRDITVRGHRLPQPRESVAV